MPTISLEHIAIFAEGERFQATLRFYEEIFGWRPVLERPEPHRIVFLSDGQGSVLEVIDGPGGGITDPHHLAFVVPLDEFDAACARLRALGVPIETPWETRGGGMAVYFNDPGENRCQIVARIEPLATHWE